MRSRSRLQITKVLLLSPWPMMYPRLGLPVIFREGSAMHGWPKSCWTTECLRKRFGGLNIEGGWDGVSGCWVPVFEGDGEGLVYAYVKCEPKLG